MPKPGPALSVTASDTVKARESLLWLNDTVKVRDVVAGLLIGFTLVASDACVVRDTATATPAYRITVHETVKPLDVPVPPLLPGLNQVVNDKVVVTDSPVVTFLPPEPELDINVFDRVKAGEQLADPTYDTIKVLDVSTVNLGSIVAGTNITTFDTVKVRDKVVPGLYERVKVRESVSLIMYQGSIGKSENVKVEEFISFAWSSPNITTSDTVKARDSASAQNAGVINVAVSDAVIVREDTSARLDTIWLQASDRVKVRDAVTLNSQEYKANDSVKVTDDVHVMFSVIPKPDPFDIVITRDSGTVQLNLSIRVNDPVKVRTGEVLGFSGALNPQVYDSVKAKDQSQWVFRYYEISVSDDVISVDAVGQQLIKHGWRDISRPSGVWHRVDRPQGEYIALEDGDDLGSEDGENLETEDSSGNPWRDV